MKSYKEGFLTFSFSSVLALVTLMSHIHFRLKMSTSTKCLLGFWMRLQWIYTSNQERTVILTVSWIPIQECYISFCYLDLLFDFFYQCFIVFSLPLMFIANAHEKWHRNVEKSYVVSFKVKCASIIKTSDPVPIYSIN